MPKFNVLITETVEYLFEVEADSAQWARVHAMREFLRNPNRDSDYEMTVTDRDVDVVDWLGGPLAYELDDDPVADQALLEVESSAGLPDE